MPGAINVSWGVEGAIAEAMPVDTVPQRGQRGRGRWGVGRIGRGMAEEGEDQAPEGGTAVVYTTES